MSEETFVRELERRADAVHPVHLGFDQVRRTAHRIRRRRRLAASGAAATVVAALVLGPSMLAGTDRESAPDPAPPPAPATAAGAYLHDGTMTFPGGRTADLGLDDQDVTQLTVLDDGRIVVALSRPQEIRVYAADGTRTGEFPVPINLIRVSSDHHLVAWVGADLRVWVLEGGVTPPVRLKGIPVAGDGPPIIDAVAGSDCAAGGCTVWGGDGTTTTAAATLDGSVELSTSEPLRIEDISPDGRTWAVSLAPGEDEQFGCAALYDVDAGAVAARSCDTSGLRFSPDGRYLLGARGDNGMYGEVGVYDTRLDRVGGFDVDQRMAVKQAAWAGDSELLVVTVTLRGDPQWELVRSEIAGGAPETLVGPVSGPDAERPSIFHLAQ